MKKNHYIKRRIIKERLFLFTIFSMTSMTILPLGLILFNIVQNGIGAINWDFFTQLPAPVGEIGGGISNALVGSFILVGIAGGVSIPIGLGTGIFLSENENLRWSHWVRTSVDVLQGTPSIVIGILAYIWIVVPMGGFSALSGGLALGLMMLPLIIRTTEETVRRVPKSLIEASLALGAPYYKTVLKVVIPTASHGIISGVLLGFSRVFGETAPLLFTAFGHSFMALNILKPVNAMPLVIFNYAMSPYDEWQQLAWGTSLVLIVIVLGINIMTKVVKRNETSNYSD